VLTPKITTAAINMKYQVLAAHKGQEYREIPVLKPWRCGDGCCSGTDQTTETYVVGQVIDVTEDRFDHGYAFLESVDADGFEYWDHYRPAYGDIGQYVTDGYLKLVTRQ
jgi:hypothetical protein